MSKKTLAFKLISGEEIIAKVVSETDDVYVLQDALALYASPGPQGVQVNLIPFMMSNQDAVEHTLERRAVVMFTTPSQDLEKAYSEKTSGIDLTSRLP